MILSWLIASKRIADKTPTDAETKQLPREEHLNVHSSLFRFLILKREKIRDFKTIFVGFAIRYVMATAGGTVIIMPNME